MEEYNLYSADKHSIVRVVRTPTPKSSLLLTVYHLGREVTRATVSVGHLGGATQSIQSTSHLKLVGTTWAFNVQHRGKAGFCVQASRSPSRSVDGVDSTTGVTSGVEIRFECGGKGGWFGLGHLMCQHWPLERGMLEVGPLYPFDNGPTGVCTMVVPAFISASGLMAFAAEDGRSCLHGGLNAPKRNSCLFEEEEVLKWGVGVANFDRKLLPVSDDNGDGLLRLQGRERYDGARVRHPLLGWTSQVVSEMAETELSEGSIGNWTRLSMHLIATDNAKDAHQAFIKSIPWVPKDPPPVNMMRHPIWTTWAKFKMEVTQNDVLGFATDIVERDLPRSVMEIDDRWSMKYGDLEFDKKKFPDPKGMVDTLHSLGFKVTLWVVPFAERESKAILEDADRDPSFFVMNSMGKVGFFDWWQPTEVAALDVTNNDACEWFLGGLYRLCSQYGIDGFKFDAGEPSFLPKDMVTMKRLSAPSDYTRLWVHRVASKFALSEVRTGVQGCQSARSMFRLFDRFSSWGHENGLRSMIPALLTSGILGFPFVLPDMVGGNVYGEGKPEFELIVRWAQANAAMPAIQLSLAPWDFRNPCVSLFKDVLRWRAEYFWPRIEALIKPAADRGEMICRPMWFAEPDRPDAVKISDQFLLGENVVVAPVVYKGQRERRVFLPSGIWRRVILGTGKIKLSPIRHQGPVWLERIPASIEELACFERTSDG